VGLGKHTKVGQLDYDLLSQDADSMTKVSEHQIYLLNSLLIPCQGTR